MSDPAGDVLLAKTDLEVLERCCALSSSAAPTCSPSTSGRSDAIERNLLPLCGRTPASLTSPLNELARMFGVCKQTIHRARTKRTWRLVGK